MQHVSAFSRPQTVPAVPTVGRKSNLWILDSWRDLVLYVCTPLLLVPIFIAAQGLWAAEDIYLFGGVRCNGTPPAGDDSRLWRPRLISAFPMAIHLRADLSRTGLRGVFSVGPEGHCAGCVCVGRLARNDANIRVLPHLRCEGRLLR